MYQLSFLEQQTGSRTPFSGEHSRSGFPLSKLPPLQGCVNGAGNFSGISFAPAFERVPSHALQEPVAFWGGFTAGALALNLKEDPLRSWIERTAADAKVRHPMPALHHCSNPRSCNMRDKHCGIAAGAHSIGTVYSATCTLRCTIKFTSLLQTGRLMIYLASCCLKDRGN